MAVRHKKDVEKLMKYERSLLLGYTRFIQFLIEKRRKVLKAGLQTTDLTDSAKVTAKCLCSLLVRGYDFNCRKELVNATVPLLNYSAAPIRAMTLRAVRDVFKADASGDATLESVRIISRLIKQRQGKGSLELLECFTSLPLSQEILTADVKTEKTKQKKQLRKEKRKLDSEQQKELDRDLKEAEAEVSVEHRKRTQTALLTEVFTTYFRILKQTQQSKLLPVVLKGLAKYVCSTCDGVLLHAISINRTHSFHPVVLLCWLFGRVLVLCYVLCVCNSDLLI